MGRRPRPAPDFDLDATWRAVEPDDVLCLIYTSGTTGPPKGVEQTYERWLAMAAANQSVFPLGPDDTAISYLPAALGLCFMSACNTY